jgi:hypothetical protein
MFLLVHCLLNFGRMYEKARCFFMKYQLAVLMIERNSIIKRKGLENAGYLIFALT